MDKRQRLIRLLAERGLQEGNLTLASGRSSSVYLDAKQVTYDPEGAALVGEAVLERIRDLGLRGVGGLTMGADAVIVNTIWAARAAGLHLSGFVVRKSAKEHGLRKAVEGIVLPEGSRVAVVDDVVTSGGSALKAVEAATEAGMEVVAVVPLVDREEGAEAAVRERGIEFRPVCTLAEVRAAKDGSYSSPTSPSSS